MSGLEILGVVLTVALVAFLTGPGATTPSCAVGIELAD